jgi:hypothetical protein
LSSFYGDGATGMERTLPALTGIAAADLLTGHAAVTASAG